MGSGLALGHETVSGRLVEAGLLRKPFACEVKMLDAYYLLLGKTSKPTPALEAFQGWLMAEVEKAKAPAG